jgi:TonB family protein
MRRLAIFLIMICCSPVFAQKWTGKVPHPPTEVYFSRVGTILHNTLVRELAKHPERVSGAVRVALRIDRQGHTQIQQVVSTTSNQWVQDTALRVVRSVKLPPMPKEVAVEQGHDWADFQAEWSFERHD